MVSALEVAQTFIIVLLSCVNIKTCIANIMIKWFKKSLTRKIGGLSAVLLYFLLVSIVYSVFKLQQIGREMRELAEVDIPLVQIMTEIEFLQDNQHVVLMSHHDNLRLLPAKQIPITELSRQFNEINQRLSKQVELAIGIVTRGLNTGKIRVKVEEHRLVIESMMALQVSRRAFEEQYLAALVDSALADAVIWTKLESLDNDLDTQVAGILFELEALTAEIAEYAVQHEHEIVTVNAILGCSGLIIGLYLTRYIIRSFRKRLANMRLLLDGFYDFITQGAPFKKPPPTNSLSQDELSVFEKYLTTVIDKLSNEMTTRNEAEKELIELATKDKLTGAYNRHKWDEQLQIELNLAARGSALSVLYIDADHFKQVNDRYGHSIGDKVLQSLALTLTTKLRQSDYLYRIGGEEFAVLLRNINAEQAANVAEKLRAAIAALHQQELPQISVSIGVSSYRKDDNISDVLNRADEALYCAKNNGRNRVEIG